MRIQHIFSPHRTIPEVLSAERISTEQILLFSLINSLWREHFVNVNENGDYIYTDFVTKGIEHPNYKVLYTIPTDHINTSKHNLKILRQIIWSKKQTRTFEMLVSCLLEKSENTLSIWQAYILQDYYNPAVVTTSC